MVIVINILVAFITMQSCITTTKLKKEEIVIEKELCLIKSIPGGSRAHIFLVSKKGELSYCIGQVLNFENGKFDTDEKYKVKTAILNSQEMEVLKTSFLKISENFEYKDTLIVKGNWQYSLYLDKVKKGFWYSNNKEEIPRELKEITDIVENKIRVLHKLPGTS
jgi:hypothetical protein